MKTVFLIFISIFILGCSGRVQTNPEPKKEKVVLPNKYNKTVNTIDENLIKDFDNYSARILTDSNASATQVTRKKQEQKENKQYEEATKPKPKKTLWQVGLDIAKEAKK